MSSQNFFPNGLSLSREKEVALHQFSEQIGNQNGQLVTNFLSGFLTILLSEGKSKSIGGLEKSFQPNESVALLTAGEVAKILKISKSKAYLLMKTKEIPCVTIGRTVRVRLHDLKKFIEE